MVQKFENIVAGYEAGLPNSTNIRWVSLKPADIQREMQSQGVEASYYLIRELLDMHGYRKRKYTKDQCLGNPENRDGQFKKIARLKQSFIDRGLPVLSIDTKKKEPLGNFDRNEQYFGKDKRKVNDHDFLSHASGIVVPHGIYDLADNKGYITLGCSKDTSEFVCENISWYWNNKLQWKYPDADCILLLCDGGGSNSCHHYIVKQDLVKLSKALNTPILVAHYPAYCSKWNPIEHKLFSHLHRAWEGAIFSDLQIVKELALKTSTKTGLEVEVRTNSKTYETGRKVMPEFKKHINEYIIFDDEIPKWNYLINLN